MPNRPSTAEILAAARAADGKRRGAAPSAATNRIASLPVPPEPAGDAVAVFETNAAPVQKTARSVASNGHLTDVPPRTALMIATVRGRSNGATSQTPIPPSAARMLAEIRNKSCNGSAAGAPPSVARMLASVRGKAEPVFVTRNRHSAEKVKSKSPPIVSGEPRGKTADILAAARRQGAAKPGKPSEKSTKNAASPAELNGSQPATGATSRTADILAAARKQGAAKGTGNAPGAISASAMRKPAPANHVSTRTAKSPSTVAKAADDRPQPASIANILAAVRCDSALETTPFEYPPLGEMIASLRRQSEERRTLTSGPSTVEQSWIARVRDWFGGRGRRIAVRQFDQS